MENVQTFEELYLSLIKKEENQSKQTSKKSFQNISKLQRSCSPGRYQTLQRNKATSSNMASETIAISSQHSAISIFSLDSEAITITSTKWEQRTTTVCQDILSVKDELNLESSCEFSGLSFLATKSDKSLCQDDGESQRSIAQDTYEATDEYQSGESKKSNVRHLCKDCKNLYKKLRKRKRPDIIKDPHTTDPKPWYSKSWIFVNRSSARGCRKSLKRGLESVMKRIRSMQIAQSSPTARIYRSCCRSHLFLKRNIRSYKEEQKRLLYKNLGEKKRKQPTSERKSRKPKKSAPTNQETSKKTHKPYSFVLDSSQEEDVEPEMKKIKLEIKNTRRKSSLKQTESDNSRSPGHSHSPSSGHMILLDQPERVNEN